MTRLPCRAWIAALLFSVLGVSAPAADRPNFVVILLDDLGYSDLGCYGGEIRTPNIDALAAGGLRFNRFYNASRCCPTRASLLTGFYPHQVGLARNGRNLSRDVPTLAESLRAAGYATAMSGKWHLSETDPIGGKPAGKEHFAWLNHHADFGRPFADPATYPAGRGFERHYGPIWGVVDYFDPFSLVDGTEPVKSVPPDFYLTDAITDKAVEYVRDFAKDDRPFFLYVAHCAPHWPLHARPEDIARYRDVYRGGWLKLREDRYRRQVAAGLFDPATHTLPPLTGNAPDWDSLDEATRDREAARMAVHAAMVDRVDQGVGEVVAALKAAGRFENTVVYVLADNGASPEHYHNPGFDRASETRDGRKIDYSGDSPPGPETTWDYIGPSWASAVNTPYRYWKKESFDGGCRAPLIVHWPAGLKAATGSVTGELGHVIDLAPTCLDLAAAPAGEKPPEGKSLAPVLRGERRAGHDALFFEHEGGRAVIAGDWKLVALPGRPWELYHVSADATETRNLAADEPARVADLAEAWNRWAARVGAEVPARAR
jgi:arylsulfatase